MNSTATALARWPWEVTNGVAGAPGVDLRRRVFRPRRSTFSRKASVEYFSACLISFDLWIDLLFPKTYIILLSGDLFVDFNVLSA